MAVITGTSGNDTLGPSNPGDILRGLAGNDVLTGSTGNEQLDGGTGADTMNGGTGNDAYVVDNPGDVVNDPDKAVINTWISFNLSNVIGGATDLTLNLKADGITGTGSSGDDVIISYANNTIIIAGNGADVLKGGDGSTVRGGAGNDYLEITGSSGNGRLIGGAGDDTYVVSSTSGSLFIDEYSDGASGIDTVFTTVDFSLTTQAGVTFSGGTRIENLTLAAPGASSNLVAGPIFGEGNGLDNVIIGNRQDNTLNGLVGNDTIYGSMGDDTIDGGADDDNLFGEIGNDTLIAGTGTDTLTGGVGDDTYFIDSNDTVVELAGEGSDTVNVSGTWATSAEVEFINITGTSAANITLTNTVGTVVTGNSASNSLVGGSGADTLYGGAGIDNLTGGAGADTFAFGGVGLSATGSTTTSIRRDIIVDFTAGDKIQLDKTNSFGSIVDVGPVLTDFFAGSFGGSNSGMDSSSERIVYNLDTGALYYNQNGSTAGAGAGGFFATLTGTPVLTAADFTIV
ncbi:beta strand repeat-containing protein [Anabaena sp. WFMT]|uniref:beta strand repeat-containing protein n=1 Tax=Anabaena sp. WFMT TaxID=3449730 RepID=UPI003F25B04D